VSQWNGNPAFTVHAVCYIAILRMLLEQQSNLQCVVTRCVQSEVGSKRGDGPGHPMEGGIQRVKLQKVHFIKI